MARSGTRRCSATQRARERCRLMRLSGHLPASPAASTPPVGTVVSVVSSQRPIGPAGGGPAGADGGCGAGAGSRTRRSGRTAPAPVGHGRPGGAVLCWPRSGSRSGVIPKAAATVMVSAVTRLRAGAPAVSPACSLWCSPGCAVAVPPQGAAVGSAERSASPVASVSVFPPASADGSRLCSGFCGIAGQFCGPGQHLLWPAQTAILRILRILRRSQRLIRQPGGWSHPLAPAGWCPALSRLVMVAEEVPAGRMISCGQKPAARRGSRRASSSG